MPTSIRQSSPLRGNFGLVLFWIVCGVIFYSLVDTKQFLQKRPDIPTETKQPHQLSATNTKVNVEETALSLSDISLGKFLGRGKFTDTFDITFKKRAPEIQEGKEYVIKFTGNFKNRAYTKQGERTVSNIERLSPHPSIPGVSMFLESVPNPFRNDTLIFELTEDQNGLIPSGSMRRMENSVNMSIIVSEKVTATHQHTNERVHLDIPAHKIRCFWRTFFEILDYVHSKQVMMIDSKLWNIILQNGTMMLFDWNQGKIFDGTLPVDHYGSQVHEYDVRKFGGRVQALVDDQERFREQNQTNLPHGLVSEQDLHLLRAVARKMSRHAPPLSKLLEHEYFDPGRNESCSLIW